MQIRFADSRPAGDYALVLPVAGKDRSSLGSLGSAQQAVIGALDRKTLNSILDDLTKLKPGRLLSIEGSGETRPVP